MVRKPVRKSRTKPVRRNAITWHKIMKDYSQGVIIINGHRGEGKSALGWDLAQKLHQKTNKPVSALGLPRTVREHFPKRGFGKGGIQFVNSINQVNKMKPSIIILDEASFIANSRDAMSKDNKGWLKLIAICRHKDHLLIFIHQQSRQLDIQIMMDADLVLLKRPTQLHLRGARSEFKPEIQEAYALFETMRGDTRKKVYAIDYHYGKKAMLQASMPTWWGDKVSRAYSSVSI